MADQLDPAADLTYSNHTDVQSVLIRPGFTEERTPGFALSRLRASLTTLVSIKYIGTVWVLHPFEVGISPDVRHRCDRLNK